MAPIRISFVGSSNAGKTTCAMLATMARVPSARLSVAQPIHDVVSQVYIAAGLVPPANIGIQDGRLAEEVRALLFDLNPTVLVDSFHRRIELLQEVPVFNDDCRMAMFEHLSSYGFRFVWVERESCKRRPDRSIASMKTVHDTPVSREMCWRHIRNDGDISQLNKIVNEIILEAEGSC